MKTITSYIIYLIIVQLFSLSLSASNCDPDSLQYVTVSGIISIEDGGAQEKYYLHAGTDVYILNFGPWWYQPSTGDAIKPEEGSYVEITGGLNTTNAGIFPVIVVYEINELFWRNPYDPLWNHFNDNFSSDPESYTQGIACGWPDCTITTGTYTGIVLIDTTLLFQHYFLDTDADQLPDYRLNFGPYWYDPPGDVELPEAGELVTIVGGIVHVSYYPVIIVFEIDGQIWRDATGFGPGSVGKWMHGNQNADLTVWSPFDTLNQIRFQNGWHQGGLPGSMYCQMLEVHHQNLFSHQEHKAFAGFEVACFNQNREKYMNNTQYSNGMMFNNQIRIQFHYTPAQLDRNRIRNKDRIRLHYWDRSAGLWIEENDIVVDTINFLVTLQTYDLQAYYLLSAEKFTGINTPVTDAGIRFIVSPNPVDEGFTIEFPSALDDVEILLLDATGQVFMTKQMSGILGGGSVYLSTTVIPAGIYFVRVSSGNRVDGQPVLIQR